MSAIQKIAKFSLIAACIVTGIAATFFVWRYVSAKKQIAHKFQQESIQITKQTATKLDAYLGKLAEVANGLAHDLSEGAVPLDTVTEQLKKRSKDIFGLGVSTKTSSPYVYQLDNVQTVTALKTEKALVETGTYQDPFVDPISKAIVLEYAVPFYDKNHTPLGVVFASYSLEDIAKTVKSLFPGSTGFAEIISDKGQFIYSSDYALVEQKIDAITLQTGLGNIALANNVKQAIGGNLEFFTDVNSLSEQESFIIFERLTVKPSWFAVGVFATAEFRPEGLDRLLKSSFLLSLLFVVLLILLALGVYRGNVTRLWIGSFILALGFVLSIVFLWYLTFTNVARDHKQDAVVSKKEEAQDIVVSSVGMYVHEITVGIDTVSLAGYVWQQYPVAVLKKFTPGILFPQAASLTTKDLYTVNEGNLQTKVWSVNGTFHQNFNYAEYPFDVQHIKIELWPNSFGGDVKLVPDLNGYKVLNPTALPGINNQIHLQSWVINSSYFNYYPKTLLTNFGLHSADTFILREKPAAKTYEPVLNFNIVVNRHILSTLILSLLPIVIILLLLFIILLMCQLITFQKMFTGIASLFFTSIVAYTNFRNSIPIQQVVFFDYLYFLIQLMILAVALLSIIFYMNFDVRFVRYRDMLVPKIIFWPLATGTILVISVMYFF